MNREFGVLSLLSNPFKVAANFGANLGSNFRERLRDKNSASNSEFDLAVKNQYRFFEILPNTLSQENVDLFIEAALRAKPIQYIDHNGFANNLFALSDIKAAPITISGEITDPYTGDTISFANLDELYVAFENLQKERKKLMQERLKMDLLLASAGDPEQVQRIYEVTAPNDKDSADYQEHYQEMLTAVDDALKASFKSMTLEELKSFSSDYPSLATLIAQRESHLQKANITLAKGKNLTHREIDQLKQQEDREFENINIDKLAFAIDNLSHEQKQELVYRVQELQTKNLQTQKQESRKLLHRFNLVV